MKPFTFTRVESSQIFELDFDGFLAFRRPHNYGVEPKRINEAVRNNPDKFPTRYMFELSKSELRDLRSKISTTTDYKPRVIHACMKMAEVRRRKAIANFLIGKIQKLKNNGSKYGKIQIFFVSLHRVNIISL